MTIHDDFFGISGQPHTMDLSPKVTNNANHLQPLMTKATKRVPVTPDTLQKLKLLGHKGQTYDELLNAMMEAYKKEQFIKMLDARRKEGIFVSLDEAFE
jgi:hypothetical protein